MSDDEQLIELRGVDSLEDAGLTNIFVAGQPLGRLVEAQRDRIDELEERLDDAQERAMNAEMTANTALGAARAADDGARADGAPNKTDLTRMTARDALVKNGIKHRERSLPIADIPEMMQPEHDIEYQTAKRAAQTLAVRWEGIALGENAAGQNCLKVDPNELRGELVGLVEESLGRDDLTNSVVSRNTSGGDL